MKANTISIKHLFYNKASNIYIYTLYYRIKRMQNCKPWCFCPREITLVSR